MELQQLEKLFDSFSQHQKEVIFSKTQDYANSDCLSNFKLAGGITGSNAHLNCLSLIGTKVARLGVLLNKNGLPNNESISDTLTDLANYTFLLTAILEDEIKLMQTPVEWRGREAVNTPIRG